MQLRKGHVHDLGPKDFIFFIGTHKIVLLSVLVLPFLKRCRDFVLEFEEIAGTLEQTNITFAQVNFLDSGGVLDRFGIIRSFPCLILCEGLEDFKIYRGALTKPDIVSYLDRFLYFPTVSLVSASSLPGFKKSSCVVVVGYVDSQDDASKESFGCLVRTLYSEYCFGASSDSSLAFQEGSDMPGVAIYKVSDSETNVLPLAARLDDMVAIVRKAALPLMLELVLEVHDDLLDVGISVGYIFVYDHEERARLTQRLRPLAREYRGRIQFCVGNPTALDLIREDLHLDMSNRPVFAIREPVANLRYPMNNSSDDFEADVKAFVQDYLNGMLKPTIRSEPLPDKSMDGVVKVVGLNYYDIVMDTTKDVLLTYCISPCGPCEAFDSTLVTLAKLYGARSDTVDKMTIAKVMYDRNDLPERGIRGFPCVRIFPAGSKGDPVEFEEGRTFDNLVRFIHDYGTHKSDVHKPPKYEY